MLHLQKIKNMITNIVETSQTRFKLLWISQAQFVKCASEISN